MRRRRRGGAMVFLGVAALATGMVQGTAAALPATRLVYDRDAAALGCPDRDVFEAAVRARLGREPFRDDGTRSIRVRIQRQDDGTFAGVLTVEGESNVASTRRLTDPADCQELVEQVAFTASVLLDPLAPFATPAAPEPPVTPAPAAPRATPSEAMAVEAASAPTARPASWRWGGGLAMVAGHQERWSAWPQLRLVAERVGRTTAQSATVSAWTMTDLGDLASTVVTGTLAACWQVAVATLAVCPELVGGLVRGTESGYVSYVPVGAVGVRVAWDWTLLGERLRLFAAADRAFAGGEFRVHESWHTGGWFALLGTDILFDGP